jgi:hypothetical protein
VTTSSSTLPPDECVGGELAVLRCLVEQVVAAPECTGQELGAKLERRLSRTARFAERAEQGSGRRARRALRSVASQSKRAAALALKRGSQQRITLECAQALWADLDPIRVRAAQLAVCDDATAGGCPPDIAGAR